LQIQSKPQFSLHLDPLTTGTDAAPEGELTVARGVSVGEVAAGWDTLADRLRAAPFLRPGWLEAWTAPFARRSPTVVTARRDGQLVGLVPVIRRADRAVASPFNSHTPFGGGLAADREAARALVGELLAMRAPRVDLTPLESSSPLLDEMRAACERSGAKVIERVVAEQPYVDTSGGDFDAYQASLPRKHRKEVGRLRRRLEGEGELRFDFDDGGERLDALLDEGFAIEGSGWKAEAGSAINSFPEARRFYTDVARWAAARGELRLAFLRLDGRALAFDLCLESAGSTYALKGGYDPDFRKFGPGMVLTHESLKRAFASPDLRSYEFLGVADDYKLLWTPTTWQRVRIQAFSRGPLGLANHAAWRHGRPLTKRALARLKRS
jgi:CelD/BcsL family acetyltransferase involved in cellulose biosynthesis